MCTLMSWECEQSVVSLSFNEFIHFYLLQGPHIKKIDKSGFSCHYGYEEMILNQNIPLV